MYIKNGIIYIQNGVDIHVLKYRRFINWELTQICPNIRVIRGWFTGYPYEPEYTLYDLDYEEMCLNSSPGRSGNILAHWDFSNVEVIDGFMDVITTLTINFFNWNWSNVRHIRNTLMYIEDVKDYKPGTEWDLSSLISAHNFLNEIKEDYSSNILMPKLTYKKGVFEHYETI